MLALPLAAQEAPQVVEFIRKEGERGRKFLTECAISMGLTYDQDYIGWIPMAIILYHYLYPPISAAWHIEQQVVGVLDQLYSWLGGAGRAIDAGVADLEQVAKDITRFF
jgi:hypothetical protein